MQKKSIIVLASVLLVIGLSILIYFLINNRQAGADEPAVASRVTVTASETLSRTPDITDLSWPKGQTVNAPILMYHHVGPLPDDADSIRKGLTVSAEEFEGHLQLIKDRGYQVITLQKIYELVAQNNLSEKAVVLTFDDGYGDNFDYAWPAMQKFGYTGTFFVISSDAGKDEYMDQLEIKKLADAGNEIGSHTVSHPDLANLSGAKVKTEVEQSKTDLEKMTGQKIISFCYPAGKFSPEVEKAVAAAGYKIAVTTVKWQPFSTDKPFEVPRYRVNPGTSLKNLLSQ